jgi:hypothetical protein
VLLRLLGERAVALRTFDVSCDTLEVRILKLKL